MEMKSVTQLMKIELSQIGTVYKNSGQLELFTSSCTNCNLRKPQYLIMLGNAYLIDHF